ncbi:MAG: aldo/keto reductase [Synergistaceae bacterium]|nr:aldo/keto reductase [Synergistaceae bacterium]
MEYRKLGQSDIEVSVVGLGTWALGNDFFGEVDTDRGIMAIQKAIDIGINLIDTAPAYGQYHEAETTVGRALKGRRQYAVISTKCGVHRIFGEYVKCLSPNVIRRELENSLKRLDTDYIDIYMLHWPDLNFGIEGALDLLANFRREGKIRAAAVSNFNVKQIKIAQKKADIVGIQPPCSLFDRSSFDNGIIPYCRDNNIGVMTYGSLGGGILSGAFQKPVENSGRERRSSVYNYFNQSMWGKCNKVIDTLRTIANNRGVSIAEVSINWVLAQPGVTSALVGSTNPDNVARNAAATHWELNPDELSSIEEACKKFMS